MTQIYILVDKPYDGQEKPQPFAFFIEFNECYSIAEGHGPCALDYALECKEATPKQRKELFNHMVNEIGYTDLVMIKKPLQ
jgi:hypothetical protein